MVLDETSANAMKTTGAILKDCLDTGVYQKLKVTPALGALVQFGIVVKTAIEANEEDKGEAALKEIDEIAKTLDKIDERMKENFDDLKAFIGQYSFYNDVPLVSNLLSRYASTVMSERSNDVLDETREKYDAFPPLECARRLNHQLNKTTTNPMKLLMAADPLKGKETFQKWFDNYESVFMQLYIMEALAVNWFNNAREHRMKLVEAECELFHKNIEKWYKEYTTSEKHWPQLVEKVVEEIVEKKGDSETAETKAKAIAKRLESILTKDMFYVLVFPESFEYIFHENRTNQMLRFRRNGYNVVVYRSVKAFGVKTSEIIRALHSVHYYRDRTVTGQEINKHYWFTQEDMKQFATRHVAGFPDCGAILAVKSGRGQVAVAWTDEVKHKNGCGDYGYCNIMQYDKLGLIKYTTPTFFFAGYQ